MIYIIIITILFTNIYIFINIFNKGTYYGCDKVSNIELQMNLKGKKKIYNERDG